MNSSNPPVSMHNLLPDERSLAALQFTEGLPLLLMTLLERRYLTDFQEHYWRIETQEGDRARPLLREVVGLGRPKKEGEWSLCMPYVLSACHEAGQALMLVLHGEGERHRLYLGGRRLIGRGAGSTEEYLMAQGSAFKAYFPGLQMSTGGLMRLDDANLPTMATFLQTAPTLALVTGIPSGRQGHSPFDLQSLDRLVKAVGNQRFVLMVVAEPLDAQDIDQTLDSSRRLKSEIHAFTRRSITQSRSTSESIGSSETQDINPTMLQMSIGLQSLTMFLESAVSHTAPMLSLMTAGLTSGLNAGTLLFNRYASIETQSKTQRFESGKSWQDSANVELLDANAEACEQLLQQHIARLTTGRSGGWWRTAIYIAAQSDEAEQCVIGALRSLCSGEDTALDPLRVVHPSSHILREAMAHGQILSLHPRASDQGHPLGETFDALATCLNSEELAVVINLPQQELPGLPMRDQGSFALSAPPPSADAIMLGALQDNLGRNLGPITLTAEALNRHCFITGSTGYGKTNTCMQILLEAYHQLRVPFLVIEPAKTEYRRLAQATQLKGRLRVYTLGSESPLPFRLNPFRPVPGIPLGRHIDLLKAVFNASFPMFGGMSYVLEDAIHDVYDERGWRLYTPQNPFLPEHASLDELSALTPCLQNVHDQIEVVLERKRYGQEIHQNMQAALRSRLHSLLRGTKGMALNTHRSIALEDLFDYPTVIELQNLGDDEEKAFVIALLLVFLYEYAEVRLHTSPPSTHGTLRHLTLVEEAHRLLQPTQGSMSAEVGDPRTKAVTMFTDMLAEMRAYGEGFIIADQIPTKLTPETLKNSSTKIIHRLLAPDDRYAAGSCVNLNDQQMRHLNTLTPGFAVVHNELIGEAVLVKVNQIKDIGPGNASPPTRQDAIPLSQHRDRSYLYHHAGCHSCPAPCNFYHWIAETSQDKAIADALHPFLESILLDNVDQAWEHWLHWRGEWQLHDIFSLLEQQAETLQGTTYCLITQITYDWLGELLHHRAHNLRQGRKLSPRERIHREQVAQVLSSLLLEWTRKTTLDDEGRSTFASTQRQVAGLITSDPLHEMPGCASCPVRCRMLPFVAPHLTKLSLEAKIADTTYSPDKRLKVIQQHAAQHIPLLKRRLHDPAIRDGLLYCLLANSHVSTEAAAEQSTLLEMLRTSFHKEQTGFFEVSE